MRADVLKFLASIGMSEADIVRWANQRAGYSGSVLHIKRCDGSLLLAACCWVLALTSYYHFSRCGDPSLRTGVFLLQLLGAVALECVDAAEVLPGATERECTLNARYAISCAHKMGCRVFLTWEDIVQVEYKLQP